MINPELRKPAAAGSFYPKEKEELLSLLEELYKISAEKPVERGAYILIVPHAGYIFSGQVAMTGFLSIEPPKNTTFLLIGPSHYYPLRSLAGTDFRFWETPLGKAEVLSLKALPVFNEAHIPEHSLEVEIPFLQFLFGKIKIIPILVGYHLQASEKNLLLSALENHPLIISSDFSHYLPYEEARIRDNETIGKILAKEKIESYEACGATAINLGVEIARELELKPRLLEYLNSGDTFGDKNSVVGYASIAFYP